MKVGVISRHSVANYGSLWQAYALQTTIEKLGAEAININYTPAQENGGALARTTAVVSRWGKNPFTKFLFLLYQYPSFSWTFSRFKEYRRKYLKETREYHSAKELEEDLPEVDCFCTGSDQVWNLLYDGKLDPVYFLSFVPDNRRKIAYAASFGGDHFAGLTEPDNENHRGVACTDGTHGLQNPYVSYLHRYDRITVREESGLSILHQLGIEGQQVLDPTLLLTREEWDRLLPTKQRKKYLLIYQLRPNKAFDRYAAKLAKRTGLRLVRISPMFFQILKTGSFRYLPEPEEFLRYIRDAECLLTDSFHGTCFAINFRTPFIEILPGKYNARNESLLKMLGAENRILRDYEDFSLFEEPMDWKNIEEKRERYRKQSMDILQEMLTGHKPAEMRTEHRPRRCGPSIGLGDADRA